MEENSNQNSLVLSENLVQVLKEIERQVTANHAQNPGDPRTVKDFRRIFDQESSRMNQAIFHDHAMEEVHRETLRTVCTLIEILSRTKDYSKPQ